MSPQDSLDQKFIVQTILDNFSSRETQYVVFYSSITARSARGKTDHEWMLWVEKDSDCVANDHHTRVCIPGSRYGEQRGEEPCSEP